jgi:hypothetical protein
MERHNSLPMPSRILVEWVSRPSSQDSVHSARLVLTMPAFCETHRAQASPHRATALHPRWLLTQPWPPRPRVPAAAAAP